VLTLLLLIALPGLCCYFLLELVPSQTLSDARLVLAKKCITCIICELGEDVLFMNLHLPSYGQKYQADLVLWQYYYLKYSICFHFHLCSFLRCIQHLNLIGALMVLFQYDFGGFICLPPYRVKRRAYRQYESNFSIFIMHVQYIKQL